MVRAVVVHEWLTNQAGSEKVVGSLRRLLPGAPVHTSMCFAPEFPGWDPVVTTFLQRAATGPSAHQRVLPLIPLALRSLHLPEADVVVTSFHSFALHARVPDGTPNVVYCHTPPRFLWATEQLAGERGWARAGVLDVAGRWLRPADRRRSRRADVFVANSSAVARRIQEAYGREAEVVHPPVDVARFQEAVGKPKGDYHLVISRLVPYKRVDLAVAAFAELGSPLLVVGEGRSRQELEGRAPGNVRFVGRVPDEDLPALVAGARGLVFCGEEDFGITLVEAMAAGTPVIACARGGALDSVTPEETGVLFDRQEPAVVAGAVRQAAAVEWDPARLSARADRFDEARFHRQMAAVLDGVV